MFGKVFLVFGSASQERVIVREHRDRMLHLRHQDMGRRGKEWHYV